MKKRRILLYTLLYILLFPQLTSAASQSPYHSYTYDYWESVVYTPDPYLPNQTFTGQGLESGSFNSPQDLTVTDEGIIYVADTGNNRIVVLTKDLQLIKVIDSFQNQNGQADSFDGPSGVYLSEKGHLYVADANHNRVVVLDQNEQLIRYIENPQSEVLGSNFVFTPLKVAVDYADRVYVISKNMYQGIMTFDEKGDFSGFSGTINVSLSFTEKVWRILSTKEQRSRQILYIPTEFTGMDIDPDGFVYASNIDAKGEQGLRRLNPKGQDVIKTSLRNNLGGDQSYRLVGDYSGPSTFVDVSYRGSGIYSALDSARGRIFSYDDEGNLLYIFGGLGTQEGTFRRPVAMEVLDDQLLILDAGNNAIMSFTPTRYGSLINEAVKKRFEGDESQTVELWEEVLKMDSNNELAYVGIGKSYLTSGNNEQATEYLSKGKDREYYSIAYKRYRNDILQDHFNSLLTILLVGIILIWLYRRLSRRYDFKIMVWLKAKGQRSLREESSNV